MKSDVKLQQLIIERPPKTYKGYKEEVKMRNGIKGLLFTVIVSIALSSIAVASLKDGLLGYWPLDEASGKTAADASGNGNDAALKGNGVSWKPNGGKLGGAAEFDGGGEAIEDDNGVDYINDLTAITVSVWIKSAETPSDRGFIDGRDPGGDDTVLSLRYDAAGFEAGGKDLLKAGITTTGGIQRLETASDVQTKSWQHIVLTWSSGNELALYIDGELDTPTFNSPETKGKLTGATKLVIGKGEKDAARSWDGLIDDVRIYDRVLDDAEIADLAAGVLAVEASGKLTTVWGDLKQTRN